MAQIASGGSKRPPRVPFRRRKPPPKTPRYNVKAIQSTAPRKKWRKLAPREVANAHPSLVAKRPELLKRLSERGSTYNGQDIQSLRGVDIPQRTNREARAIKSQAELDAALYQTGIPNMRSMYEWGEKYTKGMVFFNALPQAVASITNRPLQALINRGSPTVQKAVLHAVGVKPGLGAARLVDTAIQAAVPPLAGVGLANYFFGGASLAKETRSQSWLSESSIRRRRTEHSTRIAPPTGWR